MATLTTTISIYRKLIYWFIGAIAILIALFIIFNLGKFLFRLVAPPSPVPPTIAFGVLPNIDYSEGYEPVGGTRFLVETISGDLPTEFDRARVFAISDPVSKFGDLERIVQSARQAGFTNQPFETTSDLAKFRDPSNNDRILTMGIINGDMKLESAFLSDPSIIVARSTSQEGPTRLVGEFIARLDLSLDDYIKESVKTETYKIENGILEKTLSLSTTSLIKTIFERTEIDDIPVVNPDAENPLVWGLANDTDIVAAEYISHDIQKHRFSTYPLRTAQAALEDLQNGNGALNREHDSNVFPIRNVSLVYLETRAEQDFLQPVYIFESDDGLFAYTSAIHEAFVARE